MNDMPDNPDFIDLIRLLIPIRPMPRDAFLKAAEEREKIRV